MYGCDIAVTPDRLQTYVNSLGGEHSRTSVSWNDPSMHTQTAFSAYRRGSTVHPAIHCTTACSPQHTTTLPSQSTLTAFSKSKPKADRHRRHQANAQHRGAILVMVRHSAPLLDIVHAPQVQRHAVEQGEQGDNGESPRRCKGDVVAKVEQRGGDGAENDGEFELRVQC